MSYYYETVYPNRNNAAPESFHVYDGKRPGTDRLVAVCQERLIAEDIVKLLNLNVEGANKAQNSVLIPADNRLAGGI